MKPPLPLTTPPPFPEPLLDEEEVSPFPDPELGLDREVSECESRIGGVGGVGGSLGIGGVGGGAFT